MPEFDPIKKTFLSSPKYAVVGASKDEGKFGTKVRSRANCAEMSLTIFVRRSFGGTSRGTRRSHPSTPYVSSRSLAPGRDEPLYLNGSQKEDELQGVTAVRTLADLPDPTHTSVSIITNPKVRCADTSLPAYSVVLTLAPKITLGLLEQAKALNIPAMWLQPGAEDETVISYIKENGLEGRAIYGGPCVLVEGDTILQSLL